MLRISTVEDTRSGVTLRLDGRVLGEWIEELRLACEAHLSGSRAVALDLSGVCFVGREALPILGNLMGRGVELRHASAFVAKQLEEVGDASR